MTGGEASGVRRAPGLAFLVSALLAAQTLGTVATIILPAVAPKVADTYGISASLIGYQISLLAVFMLVALVFGSHLAVRWGACRMTQVALLLLATGCMLAVLPHVAFLFGSAVAFGLGYGMLSPPASQLLARFTPPARRNLVFSLKQTGVPLGGVLAAVIAPPVAVVFGWQWALAVTAVALCLLACALQHARAYWDDDRDPTFKIAANPFSGIAQVWNRPALRLLSISGGCFVVVQICLQTFTVVLFVEQLGIGLITAGIVLTASQVGGVFGRVFWGWLADLTGSCFGVLSALAAVMMGACVLTALMTGSWPIVAACVVFFVLGSTASGWNGAFMAEVARLSPRKDVSTTTGGSLVYVNIGKMIGPIAFTNAYLLAGSYTVTFGLLAVPAAAGLACVLAAHYMGERPALPAARS